MQNINFRGVAKSWRVGSKQCSSNSQLTWLELLSNKDQHIKHTLNISFRSGEYSWYSKRPLYDPWTRFYGSSRGSIMAGGNDPVEYTILIPTVRNSYWSIPPWDHSIPFKFATLSSIPSNNGYPHKWMKQTSNLIEPNCSKRQLMILTNSIGFEGKFYAISLQGTLVVIEEIESKFQVTKVIEEIESKFQVTKVSSSRAVPSVCSKHFTEYFVESNGEILLIFLISERSIRKVDKVEVMQLQMDDVSWLKLDNLGNRTLFAGTSCCISVNTSQLDCRSNCVYFNEQAADTCKFYELGSDIILPCFVDYGSQ
ncbi:hypothetical protein R3W88_003537 [Solanum pinnatisectum]|uniref:KIB1-4 beta-propeller domain-containing protein n=1 Tax=Solanum pinnatisectum TaxID=50273 RepID=A0AAV9MPC4_9SOLN|nr:hypothetical protein R3W88_003537 [Solanum pinnatisectum]